MNDQQRILVLQSQLNAALIEKATASLESAVMEKAVVLAENAVLKSAADLAKEKSDSELRYVGMIERRAAALITKGKHLEALLLLKSIGE